MSLINWIGIALMAVILVAGLLLWRGLRRRFERMDGFEGVITERGKPPRRVKDIDWEAEINRLEEELRAARQEK